MPFHSFNFVFYFWPIALAGFVVLRAFEADRQVARVAADRAQPPRRSWAIAWLLLASLVFYGWGDPAALGLLVLSIAVNYLLGVGLGRLGRGWGGLRGLLLVAGLAANLLLLGYFKYAAFFRSAIAQGLGPDLAEPILALLPAGADADGGWLARNTLPLGISFFTFQQISYLVDAYRRRGWDPDPLRYATFVSFFPQLIAGPIVRHPELAPQLDDARNCRPTVDRLAVAATVFAAGAFKKVVLADGFGSFADPVFADAALGKPLFIFEAWLGALAYTFQLYFDFSAYSDMAIAIAFSFGFRLPLNFDSPYRAIDIIGFWRRWHITLSDFLRDYLYVPLGGNRLGEIRRALNLLVTMVLAGLWHGAGWNFLIWGGLHGLYAIANHLWRGLWRGLGFDPKRPSFLGRAAGWLLTFLAVVLGWVVFRSPDLDAAARMLWIMAGRDGWVLPGGWWATWGELRDYGVRFETPNLAFDYARAYLAIAGALLLCWFAPNLQEWLGDRRITPEAPRLDEGIFPHWHRFWAARLPWRPSLFWAIAAGLLAALAMVNANQTREFLYFRF